MSALRITNPLLILAAMGCMAFAMAVTTTSSAADSAERLPGDGGRMDGGILPRKPPTGPNGAPMAMPRATARAPSIALATEAARAIAAGCKQYPIGIAVVNAAGDPILVYVPDGNSPRMGYTAVRKAYTAAKLKTDTAPLVEKAYTDPAFVATIKADPNLMAFHGGLLLKAGTEVVGAIGVSGAEPGGHDDECATIGRNRIKDRLK